MNRFALILIVSSLLCVACDDSSPSTSSDTTSFEDTATAADTTTTSGDTEEADTPDASDVPGEDAEVSSGPEVDAVLAFGDTTANFDHAFYGLTKPESSDNGVWEIYVELHVGASDTCPEQDSPSPDQILIVSGIALPGEPALDTVVNLLDLGGQFLDTPAPLKATAVTLSNLSADICTACVGQPAPSDPDGSVQLTLDVTFDGGTASGTARAIHCDSMDL